MCKIHTADNQFLKEISGFQGGWWYFSFKEFYYKSESPIFFLFADQVMSICITNYVYKYFVVSIYVISIWFKMSALTGQ